VVKIDTKTH